MAEWACIDGVLTPASEARVSVYDSGFMQGVGLFETMRAYRVHAEMPPVVFRLDAHIERLRRSAQNLGWTVAPDVESLRRDVRQVVRACGDPDARVRLTVTTGAVRPMGDEPPRLTVVATAAPGGRYPDEVYRKGVGVVQSRFRQSGADPLTGHKTTSYFARLAGLREAHAQGAFEALWLTPDDRLAEGSISNVFIVTDGDLLTPPLDTPVLPGVTRATVIELARRQRVAVVEHELTLDDVLDADEVFLTNSLMEIVPVVRVEGQDVGAGKPGELTHRLAEVYTQCIQQECGDGE